MSLLVAEVAALVILGPASLQAQGYDTATLKGSTAVCVQVDPGLDDLSQYDLTEEEFQTAIELRLRIAGIRVLPYSTDLYKDPTIGFLVLRLSSRLDPVSKSYFAVGMELAYGQQAVLMRDRGVALLATTWRRNTIGTVGTAKVRQLVEGAKDLADMFANAFLSANTR